VGVDGEIGGGGHPHLQLSFHDQKKKREKVLKMSLAELLDEGLVLSTRKGDKNLKSPLQRKSARSNRTGFGEKKK